MGNTLSSCLSPIPSPKLGGSPGPAEPDDKPEVSEETPGNMVAGAPSTELGGGGSELPGLQHIVEPKMPKEQEKRKTDGVIHTKNSEHDRHALETSESPPSSKHADSQTCIDEQAIHEFFENLKKTREVISVPSYWITPFGKHEDSKPRQLTPTYPMVPHPYHSTLDSITGGPLEPPKTPTPKASGLSSFRPAPPFQLSVPSCYKEDLGQSCKTTNKLLPQCRPEQKQLDGELEPRKSTDVLEGDTQILEVIIAYNEKVIKSLEEVQRALKDLIKLVRMILKNTNPVCYETSLTSFIPSGRPAMRPSWWPLDPSQ
ncbi:rho guanine nucleotide exchange factor 7-like [Eptesicus fuscus]|uniref:rho guanine nucleotide exchange factor 7-like n=1 Tax=Eptesicus fuscus TaxID=29078 RepID=UPI002404148C|nr:rho guanine nucleotide exchange factor 7-like [Eptesicus fuscus]